MMENEGFQVTEEIDVQDLSDVKEQQMLTPVSKGLKVRISKASLATNAKAETGKQADIKALKLELRIVDGIPVLDKESGETVMKYVNKPLFTGIMDLIVWADLEITNDKGVVRKNGDWWKNKQHLVGIRNFCQALELPLSALKVNDSFFSELIGKELLVDIVHEKETVIGPDGKRQPTGTLREKLKNWKKA